MELKYDSDNRQMLFNITLVTDKDMPVRILASDNIKPYTDYTDRYYTFRKGVPNTFKIRMPLSPKVTLFNIYNDKNWSSQGIKLINKEAQLLRTYYEQIDGYAEPKLSEFIRFALEFCERAGYLSEGEYYSPSGIFLIKYNKEIRSKDTGAVKNTPARIDSRYGDIEVSQSKFKDYTVPGRFAIMMHEYAHKFRNKVMSDEEEADFHAATIYLALGFPRVEILNVFSKVFHNADGKLNRDRYNKLKVFVDNFDKKLSNSVLI